METLARPLDKAPAQPAISAHLAARIQRAVRDAGYEPRPLAAPS